MEWKQQPMPPEVEELLITTTATSSGTFVKVMTDEQVEVLRKHIAVYLYLTEQLAEQYKSHLTSQQHNLETGARSMMSPYSDPITTHGGFGLTSKQRWRPKPEQIRFLEEILDQGNGTPNKKKIKEITGELSKYGQVSENNVYNWFQNRRARSKKKVKQAAKDAEPEAEAPNEKTKKKAEDLRPVHLPSSPDLSPEGGSEHCWSSGEVSLYNSMLSSPIMENQFIGNDESYLLEQDGYDMEG